MAPVVRSLLRPTYRETLDQPAFTAVLDLAAARGAPSFDKMWRDVMLALA